MGSVHGKSESKEEACQGQGRERDSVHMENEGMVGKTDGSGQEMVVDLEMGTWQDKGLGRA